MKCFRRIIARNHFKCIPVFNRYIIKPTTKVFRETIFCI